MSTQENDQVYENLVDQNPNATPEEIEEMYQAMNDYEVDEDVDHLFDYKRRDDE